MPLSQMLLQGLAESGDIGGWQERQAKHQMSLLDLQEKQRAIADAQRLRELYASNPNASFSEAAAIDPAFAQKMQQFNNEQMLRQFQMLESQGKIEENQRKTKEAKQHTFANTLGPLIENWQESLAGRQPTAQDLETFKGRLGGALKFLDETYGYKPDVPIDLYHPEQVLGTAESLGYASRRAKTAQEAQLRNLPPAESSEHYWGTSERVDRNPITHGPEILPGTSGRRGKLGKQAPMEDFTDYNIADEQGNLVSFSPENLPKLKDLYQKIENPSVKSKLGIYINQVQQGGQLPTAKGITPEEKAAFAKEEAKGRKVGEAEATREIQHEKMTSAFDEQHLKDLINKSTPGGVAEYGTMATKAATLSTPWSKADTQLGIDAAALLQSVPRFEGPQSDADRASYEKAAGNLANPSIPRGDRIAAVNEMKRLLDKYEIKYGKESNLDEAVKGRRKAALDMLDKGEIDEAQFKTMWDQK